MNTLEITEARSERDEVACWLRDTLAHGPVAAKEMWRLARKAGVSLRTVERAKPRAHVRSRRDQSGGWVWCLREQDRHTTHPDKDDGPEVLGGVNTQDRQQRQDRQWVRCPRCDGQGCRWCKTGGTAVRSGDAEL